MRAYTHGHKFSGGLVFSVLALAVSAALAQVPPALVHDSSGTTAQNPKKHKARETLQTIMVTGSAIPRTSLETAAPVQQITAEQIKQSGFTSVDQVVRTVSADNSGSLPNNYTGGFANGSSGVSLRGLSVADTLVLVDGQRVSDYPLDNAGNLQFTDLNNLPLEAVQSIQVLKDGASSIYGSSAVGGVVNIILKPQYRGAKVHVGFGTSQEGGGFEKRATGMFGTGSLETNGYNAYLDFSYEKNNQILGSDRGFPYNTSDFTRVGYFNEDNGNPENVSGSGTAVVAPAELGTPGNLLTGQQIPGTLFQPLGGSCAPGLIETTAPGVGTYCLQNFHGTQSTLQPQLIHDGVHARFTVKLNSTTKAYLDAFYYQTSTSSWGGVVAPPQIQEFTPQNTSSIALPPVLSNGTLNPNNPFAAEGQYALIGYQFLPINRIQKINSHAERVIADLNGTLGQWNYNAALNVSSSRALSQWPNLLVFDQLIDDINDGSYNFVNPSKTPATVLQALSPYDVNNATAKMDSLSFDANRFFGNLSGGPIGVAFGVSMRHNDQLMPNMNPNDMYVNFPSTAFAGSRTVSAAFGEIDLPLLKSLHADISARYDHYSDFGGSFNPKVGVKWTVSRAFAVRGTLSRGFIAPSFAEDGQSSLTNFLANGVPIGSQLYEAHGGDDYVTNLPALGEISEGNPRLQPERSTQGTMGLIFSPVSWFSGTLDYYAIRVDNLINPVNPASILADYADGLPIPPEFTLGFDAPDPIHPLAPPVITTIQAPYANGGSEETDGAGLNLRLKLPIFDGRGSFRSSLNATKILSWAENTVEGDHYQFVGTIGPVNLSNGSGTPRYRAVWSNSIAYGPFIGNATVYYTSPMYEEAEDAGGPGCFSGAFGPNGNPVPPDCTISSFTYVNLTAQWRITKTVSIDGAIFNASNRQAPLDLVGGSAADFDQEGIIGRFYKIGVTVTM